MSAEMWRLVPVIPAVVALGFAMLSVVGPCFRGDRLGHLAYAILTGSLGVGVLSFVSLLLGAPVAMLPLLPWVVSLLLLGCRWWSRSAGFQCRISSRAAKKCGTENIGWRLRRDRKPTWEPLSTSSGRGADSSLSMLLFVIVVSVSSVVVVDRAMLGNGKIIAAGDEAHLWARKAKAWYAAEGFGDAYREGLGDDIRAPHQDYPLLNPLLQGFVFAHLGHVANVESRIPIQLLALALVFLAASSLRRHGGALAGSVLLVLLLTTAEGRAAPRYVMADGMVALGFLAALDAWSRHRRRGGAWALIALSLSFLVWSKSEGSMLALCALGAMVIHHWFLRSARADGSDTSASASSAAPVGAVSRLRGTGWLLLAIPLAVYLAQSAFNRAHGFQSVVMAGLNEDPLIERFQIYAWENLPVYLSALFDRTIGNPAVMNLLLPVFVFVWCLHPRRLARVFSGAGFAIMAALLGYSLVYLANDGPGGVRWHTSTSLDRVLFHLLPATVVWIAASWRELTGNNSVAVGPRVVSMDSPQVERDT